MAEDTTPKPIDNPTPQAPIEPIKPTVDLVNEIQKGGEPRPTPNGGGR